MTANDDMELGIVARPNPKGAPSAARGRSWATSLYTFTGTLIYRESFTMIHQQAESI